MRDRRRLSRRDWGAALALGAAIGLVFFGGGGRLAMRAVALSTGRPPATTFEGTLTVVLAGAMAGIAAAVIFALSRALFPAHRLARVLAFWVPLTLIVWRGIRPPTLVAVITFGACTLVFGALLQLAWCRWYLRLPAHRSAQRAPAV